MDYLLQIRFFGDKIVILTMKMIFYKLLTIAVGIQLFKSNLCQILEKSNAGFPRMLKNNQK